MGFKAVFNSVVFAGVLGTLPTISGQVAELEIRALTEHMSVPGVYEFSIADYRRGWFSSEVDFRVDAPWLDLLASEGLSDFKINDVTLHITHGPLVYINKSVIVAAAAEQMAFRPAWSQTEEINAVIGDQPLVHSTFITHFNGEVSGESSLPDIDYSDPDKDLSIVMSGYAGKFTIDSHDAQSVRERRRCLVRNHRRRDGRQAE